MKMNKIGDGGIGERENHWYEIKNSKQEAYDSYINETVSDGISFVMILIYFFGQRWEFLSAKKKRSFILSKSFCLLYVSELSDKYMYSNYILMI